MSGGGGRAWGTARSWGPALVAVACIGGLVWAWIDPVAPSSDRSAVRREPRLADEARVLLGNLAVGDRIMGWTVLALDGPTEGTIRIDLGRDRVRFALMVAPIGSRPEPAPVQTERYAIFYGHVRPRETSLPDGVIRATTHALARRLRAHEGEAEGPEVD